MKDMGLLHYFLGIQVQQHPKGFFLNQTKYAEEILYEAGMSNANPMPTPQPTRLDATYHDKEFFPEPSYFRSLVGKLQYLTLTRPDIQFSFNFVCQRIHSPTMTDFQYLKRILRYVRGTSQYGLHLYKESSLDLNTYSDSDWAGCQEARRSTTDLCAFVGSNMVSWCAKRQPTVSRSSTEEKQKGSMGLCMSYEYQMGQRSVETKSPRGMAPKEGVSVLTLGQSCTIQGRKNTAGEVVLQNKFLPLQECI